MASMYFIALVLPRDINDEILKWKLFMKDHFNSMVALRSPAHITLIPPFWMNENLQIKLQQAIGQFSEHNDPFEVNLKDFGAFKPRVIYVNVLSDFRLQTLHLQLQEYLITQDLFPIKKDERPFHPHVSIATRDLHKAAFRSAWEGFEKKNYEASFRADAVSLLRHNQKNWDVIFTSHFKAS